MGHGIITLRIINSLQNAIYIRNLWWICLVHGNRYRRMCDIACVCWVMTSPSHVLYVLQDSTLPQNSESAQTEQTEETSPWTARRWQTPPESVGDIYSPGEDRHLTLSWLSPYQGHWSEFVTISSHWLPWSVLHVSQTLSRTLTWWFNLETELHTLLGECDNAKCVCVTSLALGDCLWEHVSSSVDWPVSVITSTTCRTACSALTCHIGFVFLSFLMSSVCWLFYVI